MPSLISRIESLSPKQTFRKWRGVFFLLAAMFAVTLVSAQQSSAPNAPDQQKSPAVTTTVVVHADLNSDYAPQSVTVGTLDGASLKNAPLSAIVVTRDLMNDQVSRLLSDVVKNDASVEDDYVPVGYYGVYQIRGLPIDLASGLEINGMTIAGEQDVPLENKERVEILNGLAGVESGIASAGGLINYVTKPVGIVRAFDLATDQFGTAYGAADLGHYFGSRKQLGARLNLGGERIKTYMDGTAGWRATGAAAAEWKISPKALLEGNFEFQHKTEADGSGFQLLGGTTLPDINRIYRSTLLGQQSWAPPDTYDVSNSGVRLNLNLAPMWTAFIATGLSRSLIQDNVIYAYGSSIDPNTYLPTCPGAPDAAEYFFCPDGTFGIYDYRNPNELRSDGEAQAMISGQLKTGIFTHFLTAGGELFRRIVQMPGFYSVTDPYSPDGIVQDGAVYTYLGSENIYKPTISYPIEDPVQQAGPRRLWVDSHQASYIVQDRIQLPGNIQLTVGGRYDMLRDHNYSAYASCTDPTSLDPATASDPNPCAPVLTRNFQWLPEFAATFNPIKSLTLYGNYGTVLSLGPQAPWWVDNGSQYLDPYNTRQAEAGAKFQPTQSILISGAYFHLRAPFFYPKSISGADSFCPTGSPGDLCFESEGHETHTGFELNAQGKAASWLRLSASATEISAVSTSTGTPSYDDQQVINVPRFHSTVFADVSLSHYWRGFYLMPGWSFTARKQATRDDTVSVPAYNLFNLGVRYTPGGEQGRMTFRIYASNLTDKKYWSDTGSSAGDSFLWLGAPTWVRASVHYTF